MHIASDSNNNLAPGDNTPPAMTLIAPGSSLSFVRNQSFTLTWTASDTHFGTDPIAIDYSCDDGATWTLVTSATANDGVYPWTLPNIIDTCRVRVTATDLAANSSSAISPPFNIVAGFLTTYGFDVGDEGGYTFSPLSIEFFSGLARLKTLDQIDDDNSPTGFAGATLNAGLQWSAGSSWMEPSSAYSPAPLPNSGWVDMSGNVLLYHMDETSWNGTSGEVIDSSGLNYHGQGASSATTTASGKFGYGGDFSGTRFIRVPANSDLTDFNNQLTISAWIKTSGATWRTIYNVGDADLGPQFGVNTVGDLVVWTSNDDEIGSTHNVSDNLWHHVAAVWDGTNVSFYEDGMLLNRVPSTFVDSANTYESQIGAQCTGAGSTGCGYYFAGSIDELAVFKRALSDDEIFRTYRLQALSHIGFLASRVFNAGGNVAWDELSWTSEAPGGKALPDGRAQETAYDTGNLNMSSNVLLLHMDEASWNGTANEIVDGSGLAHHGVSQNGATTESEGRFLRRGVFDGVNDRVKIASSADFDSNVGTISMWIRNPIMGDDNTLLVRGNIDDRPYNGMILQTDGNAGHVKFYTYGGSGFTALAESAVPVWDGDWHHVAVTYSKLNGGLNQIYVDGVASGAPNANSAASGWNNQDIYLGYFPGVATNVGFNGFFKGDMDEVALFSTQLSAAEISDIYKRGISRLRFQVRSCTASDCSDASWQGPDGSVRSFYDEMLNSSLGFASLTLNGLTSRPYFQYRVIFDSGSASVLPRLKTVSVGPSHRDAGAPSIKNNIPQPYTQLVSFAETLGSGGCAGGVRYQLSPDNSSWVYYDGANWVASDGSYAQSNTAAQIQAQVSTFASTVGTGSFYLNALLKSDGSQDCELDAVSVQGLP